VAGLSVRQVAVGVFAVVLLGSAPFGGLQAASTPPPEPLQPGVTLPAHPFTVTVQRVRYGQDLGAPSIGKTTGRYVAVVVDLSTKEPQSVPQATLRDAIRLLNVDGLRRFVGSPDPAASPERSEPQIFVLADAQPMGDLAPGLTYQVVYLFEQEPGADLPGAVQVAVYEHTWRPSSLDRHLDWFDPTMVRQGPFVPAPFKGA
jgi:hypothetical protein